MTSSERVSQWRAQVSRHLPHLSRPQASVLALWSLGMVLSGSCGLSQVSVFLALLLGQREETLRSACGSGTIRLKIKRASSA